MPNTAIPNEQDLARDGGVSAGTMRKALDLLESEGLVVRRQGRGTFVNDPASLMVAGRYSNFYGVGGNRIVGDIATLEVSQGVPNTAEGERLELAREDLVYRLRRVRSHLSKAFMVEAVVLPMALFPRLRELNLVSSSLTMIAWAHGILLGNASEAISPGVASSSVADVLRIDEGHPVLLLDRVISTRDGRFAEWRSAECTTTDTHYKVRAT
jgi:GntR family transcriptional regulator